MVTAWDQLLFPVLGSPENCSVRWSIILVYSSIDKWWNAVRQHASPVACEIYKWIIFNPDRRKVMNFEISLKINRWRACMDAASFAPIQKIYSLQLSTFPQHTPDSNRIHTHLEERENLQPSGPDELIRCYNQCWILQWEWLYCWCSWKWSSWTCLIAMHKNHGKNHQTVFPLLAGSG